MMGAPSADSVADPIRTAPETGADPLPGRLFPYVVCRAAGLPISSLEALRAEGSLRIWHEIRDLSAALATLRDRLVPRVFEAVGGEQNPVERRRLLKIKRDLHNLRPISAAAAAPPGSALHRQLGEYRRLQERRGRALEELEATYGEEVVEVRRRFQQLVLDEDFRRGLLLSSRTLAAQLPRYSARSPEKPGAKGRQVERSLMRYLSRMVMKPTPFGTFCSLLAGKLERTAARAAGDGHPGPRPRFSGDPRHKTTHLRLNKTIYGRLLPLMSQRPEIRKALEVELNPTLREEGERWVFLAAAAGGEVFQRLPRNPVLDLFRQLLTEEGPKPMAALTVILGSHPQLEASPEEAEAYVLKLLELGFLRFRVGIPEQEVDWDLPLRELLEGLEDDHAETIARFLRRLRDCVGEFEGARIDRRRELLEEAVSLLRGVFEELGSPIPDKDPALGQMPPFYEDAGGAARLELDPGGVEDDLRSFVGRILPLAGARSEQANMRCFFERYYSASAIPLLRFYEDYYREHFKGHLERQRPGRLKGAPEDAEGKPAAGDPARAEEAEPYDLSNPFGLELIARLQRARAGLERRILELWQADPGAEEIALRPEDLEAATAGLPPVTEPCRSVSIFGHLLDGWRGEGEPGLVASNFLPGFGKYFSRFLYLLPEEVEQSLVVSNRGLTEERLTEICGDASFNANLHPPLLPWEMSYPTGESGTAEEQIFGSDLWVEAVPGDPHRLRLRLGRGGPEVIPVDLGFLNPRMRPPLFQLLARFSPAASFSLPLPEALQAPTSGPPPAAGSGEAAEPRVQLRPRITFGRLILARRRWKLFSGDLPRRTRGERDGAFFLRLQAWRETVGLPPEVFVRVDVPPQLAGEGPAPGKRRPRQQVREHLYKPQYVDFANPILVDVFSRLGEGLSAFMATFEECLPARRHLIRADGEGYATEQVLQLDFPQAGGEGTP